jgi:hypothetical protein
MTTALILLILVAAAALAGLAVAHSVKNDGYGGSSAGRTPPRSHVPDPFEPTRLA